MYDKPMQNIDNMLKKELIANNFVGSGASSLAFNSNVNNTNINLIRGKQIIILCGGHYGDTWWADHTATDISPSPPRDWNAARSGNASEVVFCNHCIQKNENIYGLNNIYLKACSVPNYIRRKSQIKEI